MGRAPGTVEETHILNIRGAVAGLVPFDACYNVTYPSQPQPHVKVELTGYFNKDLYVTGQFFVQPLDSRYVASLPKERETPAPESQFAVLHIEAWELRRWMILFTLPLRIYLKWKVKAEVRRIWVNSSRSSAEDLQRKGSDLERLPRRLSGSQINTRLQAPVELRCTDAAWPKCSKLTSSAFPCPLIQFQ
jgi:hypothetical protein